MIVTATHMHQLALLCVIALAIVGAAAAQPQVRYTGCIGTCGNLTIPYPFGIGTSSKPDQRCFFDDRFELTCNDSELFRGNIPVSNISVDRHELEVRFFVSSVCFDTSGTEIVNSSETSYLDLPSYTISSDKNKFFSVGCDTYGYLSSYSVNGRKDSTGCLTRCDDENINKENIGRCSGIGCCQLEIPPGMKYITTGAYSFNNYKDFSESIFNRCSYSFVQKLFDNGTGYRLSFDHVKHGLNFERTAMVIDWAAGNASEKCESAQKVINNYVCKDKNSICNDTDYGYRCHCKQGYYGNPYLPDGCKDTDECADSTHNCTSNDNCKNTEGSYECFCKKWYSGKGTKEAGCQPTNLLIMVVTMVGAGFIALLVGMSTTYLTYQKRKLIKLREKFFKKNGGEILQKLVKSSHSTDPTFTAEELSKATKNYAESFIIGKGGHGTVFKGVLSDKRIVAVKKSKVVDQSQINQFINEVVVLSQINHKNVVKLLGCCLETQVPLLVYEFVNNGTLYDYIHNESKAKNDSWETRLKIAAESAGALAYLHSDASIPIIHGDVKTANILLDKEWAAKVSDFGASRLVPIDPIEIATMVQGTIGYLDPEYMQTRRLTEKSDVYSFGVVLVELLTGEKAFSLSRPDEKISLSMHFLSAFKGGCLFEILENGIVNEENKEEVREVAVLASKCLRLIGEERPSMKEVAMELEGIRKVSKHPCNSSNLAVNSEGTEYLLHKQPGTYEHGDSINNHRNTRYFSITLDVDGR